jgi:hypothetical protein
MEKLLQIKVSNIDHTSCACEACEDDEAVGNGKTTAVAYCVDCQKKLCNDCVKSHKKFKAINWHKQVPLGKCDSMEDEEMLCRSSPTTCEKHPDQTLGVFCRDCKMAICVICYISAHRQHDCSDISDVIDKLRQQIASDISNLAEGVGKLREMLETVEQQKRDFAKQVTETEMAIENSAEEMKRKIERDKQTLIAELIDKKGDVMKQLDNLSCEITQHISFMESLKKYGGELSKKGAAGDVARESSILHDRVGELMTFDSIDQLRNSIDTVEVKFTESTLNLAVSDKMVGRLDVQIKSAGNILTFN